MRADAERSVKRVGQHVSVAGFTHLADVKLGLDLHDQLISVEADWARRVQKCTHALAAFADLSKRRRPCVLDVTKTHLAGRRWRRWLIGRLHLRLPNRWGCGLRNVGGWLLPAWRRTGGDRRGRLGRRFWSQAFHFPPALDAFYPAKPTGSSGVGLRSTRPHKSNFQQQPVIGCVAHLCEGFTDEIHGRDQPARRETLGLCGK